MHFLPSSTTQSVAHLQAVLQAQLGDEEKFQEEAGNDGVATVCYDHLIAGKESVRAVALSQSASERNNRSTTATATGTTAVTW